MKNLPRYKNCFVCGKENPIGLNLYFYTDDDNVYADFTFGEEHVGFKDHVHGGLLSTLLDEVMGWTVYVKLGIMFNTWELNIRFSQPLQPGIPIKAIASFVEDKKRYIIAKGEIIDAEGNVYAKGEGKYIPIKGTKFEEIMKYLEADQSSTA